MHFRVEPRSVTLDDFEQQPLHILFETKSSFWQCNVYVGIRRGSLKRKDQTKVGSHVLRSHAEVYSLCA